MANTPAPHPPLRRAPAKLRRAPAKLRTARPAHWAAVIGLVAVVILGVALGRQRSAPAPLLAPAGSPSGAPADGIQCEATEQVRFHVHAHLAVFVGGGERSLPEGIGITSPRRLEQTSQGPYAVGGRCFYWLHSHARDGVIHIESPVPGTFTLGDYFDIWDQPLSPTQVGPATGHVSAYVDGQDYNGDPRNIPLGFHTQVQLDVGRDVEPRHYTFPAGL